MEEGMWYVEVRVVWVPKQLTFPRESKKLTLSHGKKNKQILSMFFS